ncbi:MULTISPECIES: helix-turn-helix transcriptional regulator [Bradyrhizobium]|uniref:AraC family transcriptional regulator n=1 Tax=Bradyrhizobium nanningense TaxID=1325118 RepID=A0A4Q0S4K5_9BRAD|nr:MULTISPECIES: helix-turn-helix transcriptional regulator [Bradyrhizobium]RXH29503.1 AraC family transcriptional regulator [Bradyrhizobium nanningense]RXH34671.1 AraC family transcriptional regulator [Bradyrhizobium nanningense]TQF34257.1 AraC family transcriptional regulator [Bradyrhizobium sp. UNPA324]
MRGSLLQYFRELDPDSLERPVVALMVDTQEKEDEVPIHTHRKGQLVLAQRGGVTCEVPSGLWMVPPRCGVWIPGGMPHSNRATANASIYFLYVDMNAAPVPHECCTLSITPLLHEVIHRLATLAPLYDQEGPAAHIVAVLLNELIEMPTERLHLPVTRHSKLRAIADALMENPADRRTVAEWGEAMALGERTLMRLVVAETGMTFSRWRQQLHIIIALQRLSAGDSVQAVSEVLGYDSVSAFITMFKKALGKSPARYFSDRAKRGEQTPAAHLS